MMRARALALRSIALILGLLLLPLPTVGANGETVLLRIAGDQLSGSTIIPLMALRFLKTYGAGVIRYEPGPPGYTKELTGQLLDGERVAVLIEASNTGGGLSYLKDGKADIALAARRITPAESRSLAPLGDFQSPEAVYVMARTGFVMAVSRANPVTTLSFDQLRGIFSGEYTDWSQVGGRAGPIHAIAAAPGSALRDVFVDVVMGSTPFGRSIREAKKYQDALQTIIVDPGAIGMIPIGRLDGGKAVRLKAGNVLAALPDEYGLSSGDYALALQEAIYHAPTPKDHARQIADFLDEARSVTSQTDLLTPDFNFFQVEPRLLIPEIQGPVPPSLSYLAQFGLRVNVTIHFPPDSTAISAYNSDDLNQLATYLRFLQEPPEKVHLLAFCDDQGSEKKNAAVSQQLGSIVQAELSKRQVPASDVVALGAGLPLASDHSAAGRTLNRRVETWISP